MTRYTLSPRAQTDIANIWDHSAERWGNDQAERYIRIIMKAVEAIAAQPTRGRNCDEIKDGYRCFAAGSHLLFYRPTASGADVIRILHQRMDFVQHL